MFKDVDIKNISNDPDFKEDSVRERIILPILDKLGYAGDNIVRSKTLKHPYLKTGSKRIPVKLIPDYLLKVQDAYAWVLDAKAPNEPIVYCDNVEQVYSYAAHHEIQTTYFALCNGVEFSIFRTNHTDTPVLYFKLDSIDDEWENLERYLKPSSFQIGKIVTYDTTNTTSNKKTFDYATRPLLEEIVVKKQAVKRHFGVHGYFTKQSWNVVAEYIKNFSRPGDLVLDPFGGSGVTAVEALMNNRKAINVDLNPMATFLVEALTAPVNINELTAAFQEVCTEYKNNEPKTEQEIQKILKKFKGPKDLQLPKGSDVNSVRQLFSDEQVAKLSLLKHCIKKQTNDNIQKTLLLMFSGMITKINLTTHYPKDRKGGADAAAFKYYRYRMAYDPAIFNIMDTFASRFKAISNAKKEISYFINEQTINNVQIIQGSATNLQFLHNESVDYIYTDPPYGKKIPYLDLSVMWNAWLDLDVSKEDYKLEAIEGGTHNKSKDQYNNLIADSIKEMYRVLKYDRWLSFVFAHKDPEFWHLIIDTAEACGFEYVGAVPQKNGHKSFKKVQNPFTVLSGQLIISFRKVKKPRTILKANLGMNIADIVMQTIEGIIAKNNGATLEQINDELIIKGLELGFLDLLKKEYSDLTPLLMSSFDYDQVSELFTIKANTKFTAHIDLKLRINYYLRSYLGRKNREGEFPNFDDIILNIVPLLKNGSTPENQTVLSVLEDIAGRQGDDGWELKKDLPLTLFPNIV